jgi:PAS domain-containing protein
VLLTVIETTQKKKAEDELKDARERMHYATEAADIATWVYDPQNDTFVCDELLKDWFGLPQAEQFPLDLAIEKIIERDQEAVQKAVEESLQFSKGFIDQEFTIIHPETKQQRI